MSKQPYSEPVKSIAFSLEGELAVVITMPESTQAIAGSPDLDKELRDLGVLGDGQSIFDLRAVSQREAEVSSFLALNLCPEAIYCRERLTGELWPGC